MKIGLILLVITLGSLVSQANTCFVATQTTPSGLSRTLCFENLNISETVGSVVLTTEKETSVAKELEITSFVRHNEERLNFEAKLTLIKAWEVPCFVGDSAVATISGALDSRFSPEIDPTSLTVSVEYADSYDTCHLEPRTQTINYVLSK